MQLSLAASSIESARLFNKLSALLQDAECQTRTALSPAAVNDQFERFRIWAGNLGAFQKLPSITSLDHRLRESPKVAVEIQELLQDLQGALQNGTSLI